MFLRVYLPILLAFAKFGWAQSDQVVDAVIPLSIQNGTMIVMKQPTKVPDVEAMLKDPNYKPVVYSKENITDINWTPQAVSFMDNKKSSFRSLDPEPPTQICLNCDAASNSTSEAPNISKYRSVLAINMGVLTNCVDGWCEYKDTFCFFNIVCATWYNCCPEDLSDIIIGTVSGTASPATDRSVAPSNASSTQSAGDDGFEISTCPPYEYFPGNTIPSPIPPSVSSSTTATSSTPALYSSSTTSPLPKPTDCTLPENPICSPKIFFLELSGFSKKLY
ncbi:hypothetical protein BB560_001128 [Smittium megazygosporum]|uniref:SMB domain-containing protein n=1 Tax=Smittium megazygosporum TaxID=133381 RepID=A0A2T9ZIN3_9FUNG|nr:hypothetical protein BB560_001128 [Smittium megazygosporum]